MEGELRKLKILAGCPTFDHRIDVDWFISILKNGGLYDFGFNFPRSSLLAWARNSICKDALENNYDYVLFYDSDVAIYEERFIEKLLINSQSFGADIACGEYAMKGGSGQSCLAMNNKGVYKNLNKIKKPQLVDAGGTGIMLIKTDVLKKIEDPWFQIVDLPNAQTFPEDFNFCLKAKKLGIKIVGVPFNSRHYGLMGYETK